MGCETNEMVCLTVQHRALRGKVRGIVPYLVRTKLGPFTCFVWTVLSGILSNACRIFVSSDGLAS
jgi:hypothetical protein